MLRGTILRHAFTPGQKWVKVLLDANQKTKAVLHR
jgi:hypothetical protein